MIKLTEYETNRVYYINKANIAFVNPSKDGPNSYVVLTNGKYLFMKEDCEHIFSQF